MIDLTLQTIWDCLDIPNKENVSFVAFKISDENIKCFFYQNLTTGEISVTEKSNKSLTLQRILKQLPTAENFFIRLKGEEPTPVKSRWDEGKQKIQITMI